MRLTLPGNDGMRRVGKNSLAEAIRGSSTSGLDTWKNVMRRDCVLPVPETTKYALEQSSQQADVFEACDVPLAIHKLLGAKEALVWFLNQDFLAAIRALVTRCSSLDFSKLDDVIAAVEAVLRDREAQMAAFQVPALREEAASASMRLHKTEEGRVLISVHDELKWLGLDDDGKHNEWTNWLRASLEAYLEKGSSSSACLQYIKLPGERNPTPMGDVMCFRRVIYLCINKSKLAGELAQKALEVYARHIVGDRRLDAERAANAASVPREARAFVLGPEEAARQEGLQDQIVAAFPKQRQLEKRECVTFPVVVRPKKRQRRGALALDEARLDWVNDFNVDTDEVQGVKAYFTTLLHVEIQKKKLPAENMVGRLVARPPARFRTLALAAVSSYRALVADNFDVQQRQTQNLEAQAVQLPMETDEAVEAQQSEDGDELEQAPLADEAGAEDAEWHEQLVAALEEDLDEDDDILKVSEVMRAAGVCRAVWLSFRSDLSNKLLALKCEQSQGAFEERRPELVGPGIPVSVHKYKKSQDWPLAWQAVQKTQHLYQKRVRECLEAFYHVAGIPLDPSIADLARRVAEALRTR